MLVTLYCTEMYIPNFSDSADEFRLELLFCHFPVISVFTVIIFFHSYISDLKEIYYPCSSLSNAVVSLDHHFKLLALLLPADLQALIRCSIAHGDQFL